MSITADPLFVAAEVDYRRESLAAGLPRIERAGRHRARWLRLPERASRLHHRHGAPRPA